ncbi:major facilitator superfamily transporter [Colletotrichum karsti]|uniref:Major facilitator superfamily transporter n=1 Tax=Colletotrichum karsti TaxID=1095194 RepID=A0A9P6I083_9PEZI|nr:major facilitator superfamily transporter [Colletotrichum karsti]KAF9873684.1 major facilitator superfamily transporter [Colletotrichum karsti]
MASDPNTGAVDDANSLSASQDVAQEEKDDEQSYPPMVPRILMVASLGLSLLIAALDATMVATIVPTLADDFHSVKDVGCLLVTGATQPTFGKLYATFSSKAVFLISLLLLEGGSLICALARTSGSFIAGRAIAGLGSAGCISGALIITAAVVPLQQRPMFTGILGSLEGVAVVLGPIIGGAIASHIGWRWCFWINLPIGGVLFIVLLFLFKPPKVPGQSTPLKGRIMQIDFIGGTGLVGSITCLLLALEWGSTMYDWSDARLIGLLVVFGVSFVSVALHQHWLKEKATFPTRLLKNRSFTSCLWYGFTLSSAQMVVLYYLPVWFQAIQGVSARESGVRLLPMVLALILSGVFAGIGASLVGYIPPFMIAGTVLASAGAGMLFTIHPNIENAKWIGYQVLFGLGSGAGVQQSIVGVQVALDPADVPYGTSAIILVNTVGGSIFISVAQNIFITRIERLTQLIPTVDRATLLNRLGFLRESLTAEQLTIALREYNSGIENVFLLARVFYHIWWPKKRYFESKPGSIFRPVVTPSRVALLETDYNLHKSNSTYFSDLDVARTDLLAAIRSEAIRGGLYKEYKNGVMVLLAGTSCTFKKEIKPGVAFDMHSRILTWDRKWIYVVTHFAERQKGAESFSYQPWRKDEKGSPSSRSPVVYATAISKCVVKAGRLTVPPEKFFRAAGVLAPESPDESGADKKTEGGSGSEGAEKWTWDRVEEERVRALSMADGFANGLDAAHEEFHALG